MLIWQGYKLKRPRWTNVGSKLCLLVPQVLGECVSGGPSVLVRSGLVVLLVKVSKPLKQHNCWHGIAFLLISPMNLSCLDTCHVGGFCVCVLILLSRVADRLSRSGICVITLSCWYSVNSPLLLPRYFKIGFENKYRQT